MKASAGMRTVLPCWCGFSSLLPHSAFLDIITFATPRGQCCLSLFQVTNTVAVTHKDVAGFHFPLTTVDVPLCWDDAQLTPTGKCGKRGVESHPTEV